MKLKLSLYRLAGILSIAGLAAASVAPNTMHIPVPLHPWIFMFTIAWIFLVISGVFS